MKANNGLVTVMVLAVIGMLGGQTLSFADDGATAGAAPETDSPSDPVDGHSELESVQDEPEAGETTDAPDDGAENGSEGDSDESTEQPANTEAFEE